jgi:uncharacterized protein YndB with AHSA1/START domain
MFGFAHGGKYIPDLNEEKTMFWVSRLLLAPLLFTVLPVSSQAQERAIQKEVIVAAPIAQVWATWTTKAGIESFFAPQAEIDPKVGGAFHIFMNPLAAPGDKGADDMRYMALQEPRMLSFDWNAPPSLPQARRQRTFVIVRLTPIDEKTTKVTLHHTGWGDGGEWDKTFIYFDRAWGFVLANLQKRFASGPMDWTDWMNNLRKSMEAGK